MNVASVHGEASLCPTVTGRSAEAQRNEPERSRRRARSTPIPTGCARVMLMHGGPAASATHPRQVATPHEEPQPLAQPKGSSGEEGHCLTPRPQGAYRRQRKDRAHARDQLNVLDGMQRVELGEWIPWTRFASRIGTLPSSTSEPHPPSWVFAFL